ncbi:ribosome biogenesis GTP-binding protein YihA/YsxC [Paraferrimonas haliotis]|uniref:Probable GTP-binding protein EngB n=1 Tax=Paraferrimonas haliotis TaxID=2013866 RepID=A0AA37TUY8_9GAMM|nr:ribosome biogenesis GTP-binding protein YihA/YsxC [Paraferrimonas haliotis]GLS85002.1 putative GTP-binding protein EngB [Paraferrimonas haliotis]
MVDNSIDFRQAKFLTSAPDIRHLGADSGIEIAFAGRSNAGKSSALNTLTQQKSLARTSKTPGRTQLINVFELDAERRLIDLPGYGFAQVPLHLKKKWQAALSEYLQDRESLGGIVVLMDIRHPLKDLDRQMIDWAIHNQLPVLALLTKGDKLKQGARKATLLKVRKEFEEVGDLVQVEVFSSLKKFGLPQLISWLNQHYQLPEYESEPESDEPLTDS